MIIALLFFGATTTQPDANYQQDPFRRLTWEAVIVEPVLTSDGAPAHRCKVRLDLASTHPRRNQLIRIEEVHAVSNHDQRSEFKPVFPKSSFISPASESQVEFEMQLPPQSDSADSTKYLIGMIVEQFAPSVLRGR